MILEQQTFDEFGYWPSELRQFSSKKIIVACDKCGKIRVILKRSYRCLCISCGQQGTKRPNLKGKHLSKEHKRKLSELNTGKRLSLETKEKIRKNHPVYKGVRHPMYGTHPSKETRQKISEARMGCHLSDETKRKIGMAKIGKKNPMYGKHPSEKTRQKLRAHRRKQIFPRHHLTKPERIFEAICEKNDLPFRYVGDGQLWIGKKEGKKLNPDFIESNGKKIVVEIFGDYWHSRLLNPKLAKQTDLRYRQRHYKKFKWNSIFIWETDLVRNDAEPFVLNELKKNKVL